MNSFSDHRAMRFALYNLISNNEKQAARDKKPEASYQRRETSDQSRIYESLAKVNFDKILTFSV